jgi:hypothetical protein
VNRDQIAGTWKEVSGKARARWGKITDDEWTQPAVFPALMRAVSLVVAFVAAELLVTRHIRDLRAAIMRFAQGHRASTDPDMSLAPGEIRDATEAFVQLTETIRRDEADLEHALLRKEGLLREVHHRVKNNLQLIASIISLQIRETGSGKALGYNDSMAQFNALLAAGGYTYVDAVLVHWPTASAPSVEPSCATGAPTYDAKACRLATWRAYVDIFNSGRALSIGVSNYNSTHLQEIKDAAKKEEETLMQAAAKSEKAAKTPAAKENKKTGWIPFLFFL